jgi:hypothetical protein
MNVTQRSSYPETPGHIQDARRDPNQNHCKEGLHRNTTFRSYLVNARSNPPIHAIPAGLSSLSRVCIAFSASSANEPIQRKEPANVTCVPAQLSAASKASPARLDP